MTLARSLPNRNPTFACEADWIARVAQAMMITESQTKNSKTLTVQHRPI
jgi:hypothetical protein